MNTAESLMSAIPSNGEAALTQRVDELLDALLPSGQSRTRREVGAATVESPSVAPDGEPCLVVAGSTLDDGCSEIRRHGTADQEPIAEISTSVDLGVPNAVSIWGDAASPDVRATTEPAADGADPATEPDEVDLGIPDALSLWEGVSPTLRPQCALWPDQAQAPETGVRVRPGTRGRLRIRKQRLNVLLRVAAFASVMLFLSGVLVGRGLRSNAGGKPRAVIAAAAPVARNAAVVTKAAAVTKAPVAPVAAPAAPAAVPDEPAGAGFAVQVAAMLARRDAEEFVTRLTLKGYPAYALAMDGTLSDYYRVRVGKFRDRGEAVEMAGRLAREEDIKPWILDRHF